MIKVVVEGRSNSDDVKTSRLYCLDERRTLVPIHDFQRRLEMQGGVTGTWGIDKRLPHSRPHADPPLPEVYTLESRETILST